MLSAENIMDNNVIKIDDDEIKQQNEKIYQMRRAEISGDKGQKLIKKYQKLNCYHHFELIDDIYLINISDDPRNIRSSKALIKRFNKNKKPEMQINQNATREEQEEYFLKFNATYRPNFEQPFYFSDDDE